MSVSATTVHVLNVLFVADRSGEVDPDELDVLMASLLSSPARNPADSPPPAADQVVPLGPIDQVVPLGSVDQVVPLPPADQVVPPPPADQALPLQALFQALPLPPADQVVPLPPAADQVVPLPPAVQVAPPVLVEPQIPAGPILVVVAAAALAAFRRSRAETEARRLDLVRVRDELRSTVARKRVRVDDMQRLLQAAHADLLEDLNVLEEMETTE